MIAIFLAIALVIQSFRHGRQIRRLEQQIASAGLSAYDPTLERLKALSGLSEKKARPAAKEPAGKPIASRRTQIVVAAIVAVLIAAGVAWAVSSRGGSSSSTTGATAKSTAKSKTTHKTTTTTTHAVTASCATVAPVSSPSSVDVAVYNGSGVTGAAKDVIAPKLTAVGYTVGTIADAPNGITGEATSSVQYVTRSDLAAACSVATALGVEPSHVTALTLMPESQTGSSGVVVLIGKDIAAG